MFLFIIETVVHNAYRRDFHNLLSFSIQDPIRVTKMGINGEKLELREDRRGGVADLNLIFVAKYCVGLTYSAQPPIVSAMEFV